MIADDLNTQLGFLGDVQAASPHLDRLAASSVSFTHAYANHPICAPSRSSLFSGLHGYTSGNFGFDRWFENPILDNSMTIQEYFRANGYFVLGTGKLQHHGPNDRRLSATKISQMYDTFGNPSDYGPFAFNGAFQDSSPAVPSPYREMGKVDGSYGRLSTGNNASGLWEWQNSDGSTLRYINDTHRDRMPDEVNADWAVTMISERAGNSTPFFLGVGFIRPHTPLHATDEFFDMFPLENVTLPPMAENDAADPYVTRIAPTTRGLTLYSMLRDSYPTIEAGLAAFIQAYQACVASVDREMGKVLTAIETHGFVDSTIVVVTSDHGWQNGPKHYLFKNAPWDDAAQVPLLIRAPGVSIAGGRVAQPVSLIDIFPTLADVCDLQGDTRRNASVGRPLDGHSLRSMLEDPMDGELSWSGPRGAVSAVCYGSGSVCGEEGGMGAQWTVRTLEWRYILYSTGDEELYNHTADQDPHEWYDLASSPDVEMIKAEMLNLLRDTTGLQMLGRAPPPPPALPPALPCASWCPTNNNAWSMKCGYNACYGCGECNPSPPATPPPPYPPKPSSPAPSPPPAPPACESWCPTNTNAWPMKCSYTACTGCDECFHLPPPVIPLSAPPRMPPPALLLPSTPPTSPASPPSPLPPSPPLPCASWCAANANGWAVKCTYTACSGCADCFIPPPPFGPPPFSPPLPPPSLPSLPPPPPVPPSSPPSPPSPPLAPPPPSPPMVTNVIDCGASATALEDALSALDGSVWARLLVDPASPCRLSASLTIRSVSNLELACWDPLTSEYCSNATLVASIALTDGSLKFVDTPHLYVHGMCFQGFNVNNQPGSAICENITYTGCSFISSPGTALNFYFWQSLTSQKAFRDIAVRGCTFTGMGSSALTIVSWPSGGEVDSARDAYAYTVGVELTDNIFFDARDYQVNGASGPGVVLNRVRNAVAKRNVWIRMAGSGLWTTQTYNLTFSHNIVAFSTRITDSTTNHIDIQTDDSFFEYNIGYRNEVRDLAAVLAIDAHALLTRTVATASVAGRLLRVDGPF